MFICESCEHTEFKVVDSRESDTESFVRRRRECLSCGKRFTTFEIHENEYTLLKNSQKTGTDRELIIKFFRNFVKKLSPKEQIEIFDTILEEK